MKITEIKRTCFNHLEYQKSFKNHYNKKQNEQKTNLNFAEMLEKEKKKLRENV